MWSNEISCKCDVPKITRARICVKLWRSWKQTRWSPADVTNPVTFGGLLEYQYVYIYIYIYMYIHIHAKLVNNFVLQFSFLLGVSDLLQAVSLSAMLLDLGSILFVQPSLDDFRQLGHVLPSFVQVLFLLEVTAQDLAGRRSFAGDVDSPGREIWEIWDRICQEDIENDQRHFQGFYIDFFL